MIITPRPPVPNAEDQDAAGSMARSIRMQPIPVDPASKPEKPVVTKSAPLAKVKGLATAKAQSMKKETIRPSKEK